MAALRKKVTPADTVDYPPGQYDEGYAQDVNALMSGFQWNTEVIGTEANPLTFSFIEGSLNGKGKGGGQGYDDWTVAEIAAIIDKFEATEAATNLEFEVNLSGLGLSDADIKFIKDNAGDIDIVTDEAPAAAEIRFFQKELQVETEGAASYPGNGSNGDVYFDTSFLDEKEGLVSPTPDLDGNGVNDYVDLLFYHEIGHALGLRHTTEGEFSDGFVDVATNSVMSYEGWGAAPTNAGWTWGDYDIAALQHMYGTDTGL